MIKRGGRVEADEGGAVDGASNDVPGGAAEDGEDQENDEAGDAQEEADAVGDGVGDFLESEATRHRIIVSR